MKNLLAILFLLFGLNSQAQTDSVIYYGDTTNVYRIDATIHYGTDSITSDSNYARQFYHYIEKINDSTFIYQPQFVIFDSLDNRLLPNIDLQDSSWRSSGTVIELDIDSNLAKLTPIQLRDSLILPNLELIYGEVNVTKE